MFYTLRRVETYLFDLVQSVVSVSKPKEVDGCGERMRERLALRRARNESSVYAHGRHERAIQLREPAEDFCFLGPKSGLRIVHPGRSEGAR